MVLCTTERKTRERQRRATAGSRSSAPCDKWSGTKVSEVCREHGIRDATFYNLEQKYSGLGLSELRKLRQLREENGKLKRLVADLSLDRHILQQIVQKKL